jgi:hypothetical protein
MDLGQATKITNNIKDLIIHEIEIGNSICWLICGILTLAELLRLKIH